MKKAAKKRTKYRSVRKQMLREAQKAGAKQTVAELTALGGKKKGAGRTVGINFGRLRKEFNRLDDADTRATMQEAEETDQAGQTLVLRLAGYVLSHQEAELEKLRSENAAMKVELGNARIRDQDHEKVFSDQNHDIAKFKRVTNDMAELVRQRDLEITALKEGRDFRQQTIDRQAQRLDALYGDLAKLRKRYAQLERSASSIPKLKKKLRDVSAEKESLKRRLGVGGQKGWSGLSQKKQKKGR